MENTTAVVLCFTYRMMTGEEDMRKRRKERVKSRKKRKEERGRIKMTDQTDTEIGKKCYKG